MKVLITGGYGFIGSHVADRFHKEGYEVFIIDNLTSGNLRNISFKHTGYQLSVEDSRCDEIFRANRFDAVVHLAAQVNVATSISNPALDTRSNVLGLVNMLGLAHKYNVKKFIFASSAAVYGTNEKFPLDETDPRDPISPYGISKWVGESYCQKWSELYGLETLCFRFSNVYGPRQGSVGEGGVVSIFMERIMAGEELIVYGDGEQTRDFIYVEDVADAVYRASYSSLTGVYNLSTQNEYTVNRLAEVLRALHGSVELVYQDARVGDIERSVLDNTRIKKDMDWSPIYEIQEGLGRTYEWFAQSAAKSTTPKIVTESQSFPLRNTLKRVIPFAENLLAFGITAWLSLSQWDISYAFIDIKMFYITIIGIMYGSRQSITAVALSIGLLVYQKLAEGRESISLLYDTDFFFQIAVYLFLGLVVGYAIERKNSMLEEKKNQMEEMEEKYEFLNHVYTEVREVKEELQQRIQNSGDSFGKIHSITKELESLEPEEIFTSTVSVIESIMGTKEVSIYIVNSYRSYLRLAAHSTAIDGEVQKSIKVDDYEYLSQMFLEGKMHINKDLTAGIPLLSAPVQSKGETVALITVDGISFDRFSLYHQNLFKTTVDLVSSALTRAFSYIEATESQRYVEGTHILNKEVFAMILNNKKAAKEKHNIPFMLMSSSEDSISLQEFSEKSKSLLRETDYIGIGENDEPMILLSITGPQDAAHVLERFSSNNIPLHLMEEEMSRG